MVDESLEWWPSPTLISWVEFGDVSELSSFAELGFVGRLVSVRQDVVRVGPNAEEPGAVASLSYDGIVFEVEEAFSESVHVGETVTVAVPAVMLLPGADAQRVESEFFPILVSGLRGRESTHRYLVFATERAGWGDVYEFTTPAGVSELDGSARVLTAWPGGVIARNPDAVAQLRARAAPAADSGADG
ncbi:MAG TPA: hypothetical protein PLV13_04060 [Ilumatobacteraceae bacterium]|nr:hypothetical protein [Ilumatobacteraceae bacterium]